MDWRRPPDRPAARLARHGALALMGVGAGAAALVLLIPLAARAFVGGIALLARACVWMATSISAGASVWTLVGTIWRAAEAALATPIAQAALWGLVLVGVLALYWLQRLIGSEGER